MIAVYFLSYAHTIVMAYSYKGSISFGLVYIPVTLQSSIKQNDIGFNMIDKKTKSRVRYKKTCEECDGREVKQEDIVKGFEYEDGKYVIFEEKDFEKIKTKKDKNITIEQFVEVAEVDPIYYDKPYYVVPTGGDRTDGVRNKGNARDDPREGRADAFEYVVLCGRSGEQSRKGSKRKGERRRTENGADDHRKHDGQIRAGTV